MLHYERRVHFEDVDAAGILFFARIFGYCHEAMEALCAPLDGGYVRLINDRKIGLPAVRVDADFKAPMRYGDSALIALTVPHVGVTSCSLHYALSRKRDGAKVAVVKHVCVTSSLVTLTKVPIPDDLRAVLEANRT